MANNIWRKILTKVFHPEGTVTYWLDCGHSTTRRQSKDIGKSGYVLCLMCMEVKENKK